MKKYMIICLLLNSVVVFAQIPNPDFELWDSSAGYNVPVGWDSFDSLTNCLPAPVYPCTQGGAGFSGQHYLNLTSKTTPLGVAPGYAVSGKIDIITLQPRSGFVLSIRPVSLDGLWQYAGAPGDTGYISIYLSKWNSMTLMQDTIAFGMRRLIGAVTTKTLFSIPLVYFSADAPDSAIIVLSASGTIPLANSHLYIDSLSFSDAGPSGIASSINNIDCIATVYPNPSTDFINIKLHRNFGEDFKVELIDLNGRVVSRVDKNVIFKEDNIHLDVSSIPRGLYIVRMASTEFVSEKKLILK